MVETLLDERYRMYAVVECVLWPAACDEYLDERLYSETDGQVAKWSIPGALEVGSLMRGPDT